MSNRRQHIDRPIAAVDEQSRVLLVAPSATLEELATGLRNELETVLTAATTKEAFSHLETRDVDCVVTESEFDDGDCVSLLDSLRERGSDVPVVLWTDDDPAIISEMVAGGIAGYVPAAHDDAGGDSYRQAAERIRRAINTHDRNPSGEQGRFAGLAALNRQLAQAASMEEAIQIVLTDVCERTDWEYGELWVPDADRQHLQHAKSYVLDQSLEAFSEVTRKTTFQRGEGLPGRVWVTEGTEWIHDVSSLPPDKYIRTEIAEEAAFGAAFGVPVVVEGRIEAVLAYYLREPRFFDQQLAAIVETLSDTFSVLIKTELRAARALSGADVELSPADHLAWAFRDRSLPDRALDRIDAAFWIEDHDTGEVLFVSPAVERLLGYDREEVVSDASGFLLDVVSDDDRSRLAEARRGNVDYRPEDETDYRPEDEVYRIEYRAHTSDGTPIWLRERGSRLTADETALLVRSLTDVSDRHQRDVALESVRKRYRQVVAGLKATVDAFVSSHDENDVVRALLDDTDSLPGISVAAVYRYDEPTGALRPEGVAPDRDVDVDDLPSISPSDHPLWEAFAAEERRRIDARRAREDLRAIGAPEFVVPIGEYGVLLGTRTKPTGEDRHASLDDRDDGDVPLLDLLAHLADGVFDRVRLEDDLADRRRELEATTQRLDQGRWRTEMIQSVMTAVFSAESRSGIARELCTSLVGLDRIDAAWIAVPGRDRTVLEVGFGVGLPESYRESLALGLEDGDDHPAIRVARSRTPTIVANVAADPQGASWRQRAMLAGVRSLAVAPIAHDEVLYGVVVLGSEQVDAFSGLTTSILSDVGALVGYAYNSLDRRKALVENESVALTFEIRGSDDLLSRLAAEFDAVIRPENITVRPDGNNLLHFTVEGARPAALEAFFEGTPSILQHRTISASDPPLFEVVIAESCVPTTAAGLGAVIHQVTVSADVSRVTLSLPRGRDKGRFVNQLAETYPEIELQVYAARSHSSSAVARFLDRELTERQRDILEAAYHGGFFEQPRESTGKEIAEALGISQPAFSKQLRRIQKKLIEARYDEP